MLKRTFAYIASAAFVGAFAVMLGAAAAHAQVYTSSSSSGVPNYIPSSVDTSATDSILITPSSGSTNTMYPTTTVYPTTVGAPNTGAGGNVSMNIAILLSSGLMTVGGGLYLASKGRASRDMAR